MVIIMQRDFWQIKIIFQELILLSSVREYQYYSKRVTFEHISVLEIYEKALAVFRDYYQYEVIQGLTERW